LRDCVTVPEIFYAGSFNLMCEATIVGDTAKLEWLARINLADEGALKAIIHTLGTKVYDNAIKHEEIDKVEVSLYYTDLIDQYGNDIPATQAFDSKIEFKYFLLRNTKYLISTIHFGLVHMLICFFYNII
jgi:hypothetical protein